MTKKSLIGEHVFLSEPTQTDSTAFLLAVQKNQGLHQPWVIPPKDEVAYQGYLKRIQAASQVGFLVKLQEHEEIVGVININDIIRGAFQNGTLGFYAFSGFEGRGFMYEGLSLVISHAFDSLDLHRLEANIQPENTRSISLVKSLGFQHEGFSPDYLKINGQWKDHERFALIAEKK